MLLGYSDVHGGCDNAFNGHPPLGVNATRYASAGGTSLTMCFNGHPPLGVNATRRKCNRQFSPPPTPGFNGHPPLGVNATLWRVSVPVALNRRCFNGHPPLGVNATCGRELECKMCLHGCFNGHPPLGVNATRGGLGKRSGGGPHVSTGTHPWG